MFLLIHQAIRKWKLQKNHFESAAISALRDVFPLSEVNGCFFHTKKCLWRKIQKLSLTRDYRENQEIHIRVCAAVAFRKSDPVKDVEIHNSLGIFFNYFVGQWLENEQITL